MTLDKLVRTADVIVVARVTALDDLTRPPSEGPQLPNTEGIARAHAARPSHLRIATAEVVRVLEGSSDLRRVHFIASPTSRHDESHARMGEDVVMFLDATESLGMESDELRTSIALLTSDQPCYRIGAAGRGRMTVKSLDGRPTAHHHSGIVMPAEIQHDADERALSLEHARGTVPLDVLERVVNEIVQHQGATIVAGERDGANGAWLWRTNMWQDGQRERWSTISGTSRDDLALAPDAFALPWSALHGARFRSWADSKPSESDERVASITMSSLGVRRTVRLPSSTSTAPLDANTEEAVRAWLAVADGIGDESARSSIDAYRKLLASKR